MVAAAVVGTVGAVGAGLYSADKSAHAAEQAAAQQKSAADAAQDYQKEQYGQTREDVAAQQATNQAAILAQQQQNQANLAPYMQTGTSANNQLGYLLGLGGSDTSGGALGGAGSLGKNFTIADYEADPGYAFRLAEGQKALDRVTSAKGKYFSGGAVKSLSDYNQGTASQEFGNAYNRYVQNQNNLYSKLSGVSSQGQNAASGLSNLNTSLTGTGVNSGNQLTNTLANAATNNANQVGDYLTGAGNAIAAGTVGGANAWTTGLQNAGNNVLGFGNNYAMGNYNPQSYGYGTGLDSSESTNLKKWNNPGGYN